MNINQSSCNQPFVGLYPTLQSITMISKTHHSFKFTASFRRSLQTVYLYNMFAHILNWSSHHFVMYNCVLLMFKLVVIPCTPGCPGGRLGIG